MQCPAPFRLSRCTCTEAKCVSLQYAQTYLAGDLCGCVMFVLYYRAGLYASNRTHWLTSQSEQLKFSPVFPWRSVFPLPLNIGDNCCSANCYVHLVGSRYMAMTVMCTADYLRKYLFSCMETSNSQGSAYPDLSPFWSTPYPSSCSSPYPSSCSSSDPFSFILVWACILQSQLQLIDHVVIIFISTDTR